MAGEGGLEGERGGCGVADFAEHQYLRVLAEDAAEDDGGADSGWAVVGMRFAAVAAARTLLSFGDDVEVVSPGEVRDDLATVAAAVLARYAKLTAVIDRVRRDG